MKRRFYKWLFKRFYKRVNELEIKCSYTHNFYKANKCKELKGLIHYLENTLITGKTNA